MTLVPVPDEEWTSSGTWLGDGKQVLAGHAWPDPPVPVAWASDIVHAQPGRHTLALGQLTPPARIGVVPAGRPADVLVRLGWDGTCNRGWSPPAQVSAVLRSWEDRFGARLYEVGFAAIRLLVSRPPATLEAALPIAAEHVAFADECGRMGLRHVNLLAETLVGNRFWDFWWD